MRCGRLPSRSDVNKQQNHTKPAINPTTLFNFDSSTNTKKFQIHFKEDITYIIQERVKVTTPHQIPDRSGRNDDHGREGREGRDGREGTCAKVWILVQKGPPAMHHSSTRHASILFFFQLDFFECSVGTSTPRAHTFLGGSVASTTSALGFGALVGPFNPH